ncbi:Uncharacterised protein [Vibrio cholerae]|nr:Uncharacterised protein [Vibrio cholerae]
MKPAWLWGARASKAPAKKLRQVDTLLAQYRSPIQRVVLPTRDGRSTDDSLGDLWH